MEDNNYLEISPVNSCKFKPKKSFTTIICASTSIMDPGSEIGDDDSFKSVIFFYKKFLLIKTI